jgi:hypothetical protein
VPEGKALPEGMLVGAISVRGVQARTGRSGTTSVEQRMDSVGWYQDT